MHTRSAQSKETGTFTVTVWDWNGVEFFKGEFADVSEANEAAQTQERRMTIAMQSGEPALTMAEILMSGDDLLAELMA